MNYLNPKVIEEFSEKKVPIVHTIKTADKLIENYIML